MKTFVDNAGRTWTVTVNVACVKRVKDLVSVNLLDAVEGKLLERIVSDPMLLCDVLYVVCQPEAEARQVSDEQFGQAMAGDAVEHATTALLEELVDFFPSGKRRVLQKALAKLKRLETAALEVVHQRLDSPELERELIKGLLALGGSFGNSPDSSASIPAPSP
ncbi:MAG TPA: hypothetical protein VGE52_19965 [Pirellulales bacterium]